MSRDLAAKQQSIDIALQHRQQSLETLIGMLDDRARTMESEVGQFAAEIEQGLSSAQSRAQDVATQLSSIAKGTATTIVGQFEIIRDNANRERERTSETLQLTYDQANRQIERLFGDASARFRETVDDVRKMAAEVQRELDETREELRRGVFELPKETSDAANAMRRVVSDQIRALKELATMVTASGGGFDIAEPEAAPATAPARVELAPPRREAPQPARREPPPRGDRRSEDDVRRRVRRRPAGQSDAPAHTLRLRRRP